MNDSLEKRSGKILTAIKKRKMLSVIISIGIIVISVGNFTGAISNVMKFTSSLFVNDSKENPWLEFINESKEILSYDFIEAEREHLALILEQELELVQQHTLARRNALLVFIIDVGKHLNPWDFLKEDIKNRIRELGLDMDTLQKTVTDLSQQNIILGHLLAATDHWELNRKNNPALPRLTCTLKNGKPPAPKFMNSIEKIDYDHYCKTCEKYLDVATPKFGNKELIKRIKDAQCAVKNQIKEYKDKYYLARYAFADALKKRDESEIAERAKAFRSSIKRFGKLPDKICDLEELKDAKKALEAAGFLGLNEIIDNFNSEATIARLGVELEQILAMLSAIVDANSSILRDAAASESVGDAIGLLATIGKALERAENYPPVSKLQIQAEQLRLNIVAAQRSKALCDRALALIEKTQEARVQELLYLASVERLRIQVVGGKDPNYNNSEIIGCLDEELKARDLCRVFMTVAGVNELCRERVYRLLVAYSNSWTFGRVPQEQLDYRLIALHHEAALNNLSFLLDQIIALENREPPDIKNASKLLQSQLTLFAEESRQCKIYLDKSIKRHLHNLELLKNSMLEMKRENIEVSHTWRILGANFRSALYESLITLTKETDPIYSRRGVFQAKQLKEVERPLHFKASQLFFSTDKRALLSDELSLSNYTGGLLYSTEQFFEKISKDEAK